MSKLEWSKVLSELPNRIDNNTLSDAIKIATSFVKNRAEIVNQLSDGGGFYILHDIPIDNSLPVPPSNGLRPYSKGFISEHALSGITGCLGYNVFSYQQEKQGSFIHEVTPIIGNEMNKSSNGVVAFSFHTDAAYLQRDMRPEVLSLLCLNNSSKTGTQIISLNKLLGQLAHSTIEILKSENFLIRSPDSFEIRRETQTSILQEYEGKMEIQLSIEGTTALTQEANSAINELTEAASDLTETLMWEPGDFLVFNNRKILHARKEIKGTRWLQRCYGSRLIKPCTIIDLVR